MFPEVPLLLLRLRNVYEMPFVSIEVTCHKSNYMRSILSVELRPEQLYQKNVFSDFLAIS